MSQYSLLRTVLSDRPIAFHPSLSRAFGGVYEALLFQQLAYWSDKGDDPDWIYKTREELRDETTMNRYQQEQARATLRKLGVIEEERRGLPARMYYRVVWDVVFELLESAPPVGRRSTNKMAGQATDQMGGGEPTSKSTAESTDREEDDSNFRRVSTIEKYDETRLVLMQYAEDLAREMNDQAPLASTTTRLVNLYRASGLEMETFVDRIMQARAITQERTGSIRTISDGVRSKPKVPYLFGVLEDLLGLRDEKMSP